MQVRLLHSFASSFPDFTIAICDDRIDKVVAAGTIFVERKFVHNNGLVGHIEDIAVDGQQQGKKLGLRIIQALKYIGAKRNCYKGKLKGEGMGDKKG